MKIEAIAKALSQSQSDEEASQEKEKLRLKKPPFKTNIEPFSPTTLDNLKGWKEPNGAYILLEKKYYEYGRNADGAIKFTTHTMWIGTRPDQIEKLRYNVQAKGMRILHWGKFPKLNSPDPREAQLAKAHVNPESGRNAYDLLENAINGFINTDPAKTQKRIDDLEAKLAVAEARAELKAKSKTESESK